MENHEQMRVLVLANQKGGVGKTTTAINLGTALAAIGETVLIIDLDPQGNASTGLGIDRKQRTVSTFDVMMGERALDAAIRPTSVPRLYVAPSTLDLLGVELAIADQKERNFRLRNALHALASRGALPNGDRITYVLVDCPPSLNLLTINALAASDSVLVPLQCEFFALEGLSQLLSTVEQVKRSLNPRLTIHGVVLTMYRFYAITWRHRLLRMCARFSAKRFMRRSYRETFAFPRRRRMASLFCFTISSAPGRKLI